MAKSIEEFTYYNPIIVDKNMTIICGHTRYKALRELGVEDVVVMVSNLDELMAKEYRIADNKTTELSNWLIDKAREEYEKLPSSKTLDTLFPTINFSNGDDDNVDIDNLTNDEGSATKQGVNVDDIVVELIYPNCLNGMEMKEGKTKPSWNMVK